MLDAECGTHVFHYLMSRDISKWDPQAIPQTAFRSGLQRNAQPAVHRWAQDMIQMNLWESGQMSVEQVVHNEFSQFSRFR